jgi:cysteine desulfurase family protein
LPPRLYVDNAATSFPKPAAVLEAMRAYADDLGASAGRGAYQEAIRTGELVIDCRRRLARLIGAEEPEQVVFTANGTGALNLAIKGLLAPGDHVVTTVMEHNSVLRPLNALAASARLQVTHVPADPGTGEVAPGEIVRAIRPETRLVALVHATNVTGTLQPVAGIAAEARRRDILLLVDAAQTAGHVPIDVAASGIDLLAMPGHKGLMGPSGTGALYLRPGLERRLRPLMEGGTGSLSEQPIQPDFLPDRYEAGSLNAVGLAGLDAALAWLEGETVDALRAHDQALSARFLERTAGVEGLRVYGPADPARRVAVFSVRLAGVEPAELSALLEAEFGILTRSGLHCAPLAHRAIGTADDGGTTRLSFGAFNTLADVDRCAEALAALASADLPA